MTKDLYFEMIETLGGEPIEEEIPVEYDDLLLDVQQALDFYNKLKDEWDTMNGVYMGKNYAGLLDIFVISGVDEEDRKIIFDLISTIDLHRKAALDELKQK